MNNDRVYHIDLADFFAEVNRRRQAEGLAPVEPAVMAVRANIRLAIQRHRPLDRSKGSADLVEEEAQALCHAVRELFSTAPELAPFAVEQSTGENSAETNATADGQAEEDGERFALPLVRLYESINRLRRAADLSPIEPAVIAVRAGLRFTILRKRALDFGGTHLPLDADDLAALEQILAEQFNVSVEGGLASLCEEPQEKTQRSAESQRPRRLGWFSRLLGRRRATIDPLSLMLAISQQRARMGHRPLSPSEIKRRCQDRISLDLEFKGNLDDEEIALNQEQLDALADIIRKEFQVIFDNLEDFIDEARK
ncbi:MAG: hypothetical protein P8Y78_00530 [Acidihalobacter sp.]|jgi:hypothetical protein